MRTLRLLSYNVRMFPPAAKLFVAPMLVPKGSWEAHLEDEERCRQIAHRISTSEVPWDVVLLQEFYRDALRETFRESLKGDFASEGAPSGTGFWDLFSDDSGLVALSRSAIKEHGFTEFEKKSGTDALTDKGVMYTSHALGDREDERLDVFNLHLQSRESSFSIRSAQLSQLRDFVESQYGADCDTSRRHVIVAGDFNVVAGSDEYRAMLKLLGCADLFTAVSSADGFTWDEDLNQVMIPDARGRRQRIDYAFTLKELPSGRPLGSVRALSARVEPFLVRPGLHLSDHFGLSVTVAIDH